MTGVAQVSKLMCRGLSVSQPPALPSPSADREIRDAAG